MHLPYPYITGELQSSTARMALLRETKRLMIKRPSSSSMTLNSSLRFYDVHEMKPDCTLQVLLSVSHSIHSQ